MFYFVVRFAMGKMVTVDKLNLSGDINQKLIFRDVEGEEFEMNVREIESITIERCD